MEMRFENPDAFIKFDQEAQSVTLEPDLDSEAGIHEGAAISFTLVEHPHLTFSVVIEATILECLVSQASFSAETMTVSYEIGSGEQ